MSAIGDSACKLVQTWPWLAAAMVAATAIAVRHATTRGHPPGGATALIAGIGGDKLHKLGHLHALLPVTVGSVILLIVALIVNNLPKVGKYPEFPI